MKAFRNLRIRTKMMVSFGAIIALVIVLSVFSIYNLIKLNNTYDYVLGYPIAADRAMQSFIGSLNDMRRAATAVSTYSSTNDSVKINSYYRDSTAALQKCLDSLDEFEKTLLSDPNLSESDKKTLSAQVGVLIDALESYKVEALDAVYAAANEGDHAKTLEIMGIGAALNKTIQDYSDELHITATTVAAQESVRAAENADRTVILLAVIAVCVILFSVIMAFSLSSIVSKPLKKLVDIAENVAEGNLDVNIDTSAKDETGILAKSFANVVSVINTLVNDLKNATHMLITKGDIEARIDASELSGAYREVAVSINKLVDGQVDDVLMMLGALKEISNGNFNIEIKKLPGKKVVMNEQFDILLKSLNGMHNEIAAVASNAAKGNLDIKANAELYRGGWAELLNGLNLLVDAIREPLIEIKTTLERMAEGDFNARMTGRYNGVFETVKQSSNATCEAIGSYIGEVSKVLEEISKGDLTNEIKREYIGQFTSIKESINRISNSLNETMQEIMTAATNVLAGAQQMSISAGYLAEGSTRQASSLEELIVVIETINEGTRHNSESADEANKLSIDSTHNAQNGSDEMQLMVSSMEDIRESSSRVSNVIKTIEDISFQTNLLALNAAVEAARAGEHGKGFAVVAEEVRNLAAKSQLSAKETTEMVEDSIRKVNDGMNAAHETSSALEVIVSDARAVSDLISQIDKLTRDQAESISRVTSGLGEISEVVQSNSATSEECAAASQQLNSQAELLKGLVSFFKLRD